MHRLVFYTLIGAIVSSSAFAQQLTVNLDVDKSTIKWTLEGNVHTVHGTFRFKEGHVTIAEGTGSISGEIMVAAGSGQSGDGSRDKRMQKEILQSSQFPEITLIPKRMEGTIKAQGHSAVKISGDFEIHGVSHIVTIPIDLAVSGDRVEGRGEFSIPYVDWGLKDPSNFLFKVDKSVKIEVFAAGTLKGPTERK